MFPRAVVSFLRLPGRTVPIPGWFPLVVERLHPRISGTASVVETDVHGFRMRLDLADYTQRRIFYGCHEPRELALVRRLLRPGDAVLDVGAHVGLFTLLAAAEVGAGGQVHSFEPVPVNFEALEANVRLNGFDHVRLERAAVGEAAGRTTLGLGVHEEGGSGGYTQGGTGIRVDAPVVVLDDYVAEHLPSTAIRLLKIDVEGAEPAVLRGFRQALAERPPDAIVAELSPEMLSLQGYTAADLISALTANGYELHRLTPLGRLRRLAAHELTELSEVADPNPQGRGLVTLVRRGLAESRVFFNVFAFQPHVGP